MTADTVGGVWPYAMELIRGLGLRDTEVVLATMGRPLSLRQSQEAARLKGLEIRESDYKLEWMDHPWNDVENADQWLLHLEEEYRPDIVHLNNFVQGKLAWKAPVLVVGHSCVLSWWRAVHGCDAPREWFRYRLEVVRGLAGADSVIAPTLWMLKALAYYYGFLPRAGVIPHGRDPVAYTPGIKEPFVLSAGRIWDPAENFTCLEKASEGLPWKVKLAGEEGLVDETADYHSKVEYLGWLSHRDMRDQFSRAAICAFPALYEPFGLSILEAALSGCALVLGDIPGLREVWGDAALYANPRDPQAFRDTIASVMAENEMRIHFGARARKRACCFNSANMASAYLTEYTSLCRNIRKSRQTEEVIS